MPSPEDIEKGIARLTTEAKLCVWIDALASRLVAAGTERDAGCGARARPAPVPGTARKTEPGAAW